MCQFVVTTETLHTEACTDNIKSMGRKLYAAHALTHLLIHAHYTNLLTLVNSVLHACINTCTTGPLVQFDAFLYVYCIGTSTVHASCK